jgi:hypothetical protein
MWTMAVKVRDYPQGTFVVGQRATMFGHEHTVLAVHEFEGKPKYLVQFDGECHRDDDKQIPVYRFIVPEIVEELAPVTLDARTLESIAKAIPAR